MATTIVYPALDVSGTGSISTIVSTAGTFAGSLTASTFAVTGTATFSGTVVHLTTTQLLGTLTASATSVFVTGAIVGNSALNIATSNIPAFEVNGGTGENMPDGWGTGAKITHNRYPSLWFQGVTATAGLIYAWDSLAKQFLMARTGNTNIVNAGDRVFWDFSASAYYPDGASWNLGLATKQWANLFLSGTANISATLSCATTLFVAGTATLSGTAVFTSTPLVNRGTGLYSPNAFLLATATGATNTQFKLAFSNTNNAFTRFELHISGKGAATTTNFIIYLYTDGGTTPLTTYALAANTTATASEGMALIDICQDQGASGLVLMVPRWQHFKGVTTQATQTRSVTFTASCINCIGVSTGAATTTTTMSSALITLTGFMTAK